MANKTRDILLKMASGESAGAEAPGRKTSGFESTGPVIYLDKSGASLASGMEASEKAVRNWLKNNKISAKIKYTGSLGAFSLNPVICIGLPGRPRLLFGPVHDYQVENLLEAVFSQQIPNELLLGQLSEEKNNSWEGISDLKNHPFFRQQERRLMSLNGIIDPDSIDDYIAHGGYQAFLNCIRSKTPEELFQTISECDVRGRSGSGFRLSKKWEIAMNSLGKDIYLICNADESDPGGFMHRVLMEGNPHLVLEGMMIASYVIGCSKAIIYTRNRYAEAVHRLENALIRIKQAGLTGQDIMDSGFSLEIEIRKGPGAFICGEETALISSIEGRRGMPKNKPPYPSVSGLHGQPTVVHNVETIAQLPLIIKNGPEWYKQTGTDNSKGTKLFSLSGRFGMLGVIEVPLGMKISTIVNEIGGLPLTQKKVKALLMGGPSGLFIHPDEFNTRLDYEELQLKDLLLGSGSMVLLDESNCIVEMTEYMMSFIKQESCGKCIPCREGTRRLAEIINNITHPESEENNKELIAREKSIEQLKDLARVIAETSLCGLGKNAPGSLISSIGKFSEDWERHLNERICDAGVCHDLRTFYIDPGKCTGCYLCLNKCPEMAIVGSPRQVHVIIEEKCTGCGICQEVCKFNAVITR